MPLRDYFNKVHRTPSVEEELRQDPAHEAIPYPVQIEKVPSTELEWPSSGDATPPNLPDPEGLRPVFSIQQVGHRPYKFDEEFGCVVPQPELLRKELAKVGSWEFNVFEVSKYSGGHPIVVITYKVFTDRSLLAKIPPINREKLVKFLARSEDLYLSETLYHNKDHAADVTQALHVLLNFPVFIDYFGPLEVFAALIAATVHDVGHPGVDERFLRRTGMVRASLLQVPWGLNELQHNTIAMMLMKEPGSDILENFSEKSRKKILKKIELLIFATDIKEHKRWIKRLENGAGRRMTFRYRTPRSERFSTLCALLHCADISNPFRPSEIQRTWSERITKELFRQGELERAHGLPVTPICDQTKTTKAQIQVGFIRNFAQPTWKALALCVRNRSCLETMFNNVKMNEEFWALESAGVDETGEPDDVLYYQPMCCSVTNWGSIWKEIVWDATYEVDPDEESELELARRIQAREEDRISMRSHRQSRRQDNGSRQSYDSRRIMDKRDTYAQTGEDEDDEHERSATRSNGSRRQSDEVDPERRFTTASSRRRLSQLTMRRETETMDSTRSEERTAEFNLRKLRRAQSTPQLESATSRQQAMTKERKGRRGAGSESSEIAEICGTHRRASSESHLVLLAPAYHLDRDSFLTICLSTADAGSTSDSDEFSMFADARQWNTYRIQREKEKEECDKKRFFSDDLLPLETPTYSSDEIEEAFDITDEYEEDEDNS